MDYNHPYFYTVTIFGFKNLLNDDHLKMIIIQSLQYLVKHKFVEVYGYVIMPNHLHLIWTILQINGKESPVASFTKFTAHQFRKYLSANNPNLLDIYKSDKEDRNYQFWKRDPLAIPLSTNDILLQKLDYIHDNPVKEKWNLCASPEEYTWSSANFYETGIDKHNILTHFRG